MSDNEDLLGDDLGDQSLADYNLGNDEEDQLLADDYESGASQNVPTSIPYAEPIEPSPVYVAEAISYTPVGTSQKIHYIMQPDNGTECVVPNITVEVPNVPERPSYAPYEPPPPYLQEQAVPPAMPAVPMESPQIVPTEMSAAVPNGDNQPRERFISERPVGAQRTPQLRDIPDSLDKVVVPRWAGRGRSWRSPQFHARFNQYRRNNMHRGNFNQRPQFPPPQKIRPNPPQIRPEIRPNPPSLGPEIQPDIPPNVLSEPNIRPDLPPNIRSDPPPNIRQDLPPIIHQELPPNLRPDLPPNLRPDLPPNIRPELPLRPDIPPDMGPEPGLPEMPLREFRPELRPDLPPHLGPELPQEGLMPNVAIEPPFRPMDMRPPFRHQNPFRPNLDEQRFRPNFEPFGYRQQFRPFPPIREVAPNMNQIPQVTIRHGPPNVMGMPPKQEVRMLPVQLPPVPPGSLAGKKVLINPHFKGNFQPPVEGLGMPLPTYIPTRIQKSPPVSPTLENKFGPVKDIDDAAERFIAEQRNALARAATRKFPPPPRRSPQRYIENTTIEIENELARPARRNSDDDLLRRQEEFINANRAGLRRRMRSPSPPRRSLSPRRSPERQRARVDTTRAPDEDSEYRRRMREQEALRERVMRAKEARRRKNATAHVLKQDRDRERLDKEREQPPRPEPSRPEPSRPEPSRPEPSRPEPAAEPVKPDTTRTSPDKLPERPRERSPVNEEAEVNSTCEGLTPPRQPSPEHALTPPLPVRTQPREEKKLDSDDDLDLILGDIDGILSDDDDTGRFKEKSKQQETTKTAVDLRSKLPPKPSEREKRPRQKIVFEHREEKKRKEKSPLPKKSPPRKAVAAKEQEKKVVKARPEPPVKESRLSLRQRITFDKKEMDPSDEPAPLTLVEVIQLPQGILLLQNFNREILPAYRPDTVQAGEGVQLIEPQRDERHNENDKERETNRPDTVQAGEGVELMLEPQRDERDNENDKETETNRPVMVQTEERVELIELQQDERENENIEQREAYHPDTVQALEGVQLIEPQRDERENENDEERETYCPVTIQAVEGVELIELQRYERENENDENEKEIETYLLVTVQAEEGVELIEPQRDERESENIEEREAEKEKQDATKDKETAKSQVSNRRVILQRKITQTNEKSVFTRIEVKADPTKPHPGIFSRAVRTAIGSDKSRIVLNKKQEEPQVEFESDSDIDEEKLLEDDLNTALVTNLPHGMTDTRLKTLAGNDVQTLSLDKEDRSAKITFKTTAAAETFKKKFNNKMVAASRLTVALR